MSERAQPTDPLAAVTSAAARLAQTQKSQRTAADELAQAMYDAHKRGHTWAEIAARAGLASPHTARTRAGQVLDPSDQSPSTRWRQERGHAPRPKPTPPGLSISDAAKRLKVTRKTVYARIKAGKLRTAVDEAGRTRVVLDD